ncbi:MAG: DNA replication and repair protein RecF [Bacteriovoracaceae bacterium]|nr:DNA replication and repair protein RecF [Bacteriovoracaceae bacterium]
MSALKILKLQTTNFRNLNSDIISFSTGINCILGENGNGKTNILEAIYYLGARKSFRKNASFPQILSFDCEQPEILLSAMLTSEDKRVVPYSARVEEKSSQWYLNNTPAKKKPEIKIVFINPFDSFNFMNSSSFRRGWFDTHIGLLNPQYKRDLRKYMDSLRFRNALLSKKPAHYNQQIAAIDPELARLSVYITSIRLKFLEQIKNYCSDTFKKIFSEDHLLTIELEGRFTGLTESEITKKLQEGLVKDRLIGHTSYGIHKDDYQINFDGLNAYDFCSLGQQKMSYLSLIFAYIELFRYIFTSYPIVLIDDVSGELDSSRWQRLIEYLKNSAYQVLITTANERFKEELEKIDGANKIYITHGSIQHT